MAGLMGIKIATLATNIDLIKLAHKASQGRNNLTTEKKGLCKSLVSQLKPVIVGWGAPDVARWLMGGLVGLGKFQHGQV